METQVINDKAISLNERDFWREQIDKILISKSVFPSDFNERKDSNDDYDQIDINLPQDICQSISAITQDSDTKLFLVLFSSLSILLRGYLNQNQVVIGTTINKQNVEGNYVNKILPLYLDFEDTNVVKELLKKAKNVYIEALKNQNCSIKSILSEKNIDYSDNDYPLFDISLVLENIQDKAYFEKLKTNIGFFFCRKDSLLTLRIEFNKNRFLKSTINRVYDNFLNIIYSVACNVGSVLSSIAQINEKELNMISDFSHGAINNIPNKTINELLKNQVRQTPNEIALLYKGNAMTYKELDDKANYIAEIILKSDFHVGDYVGLQVNRSFSLIISLIGIIKAGGVYIPIGEKLPKERKLFILDECKSRLILTHEKYKSEFNNKYEIIDIDDCLENFKVVDEVKSEINPNDLMYVIYTSGSTGNPKGVKIEHKSLVNYLTWRKKEFEYQTENIFLQIFDSTFDGSVCEIFTPLICGSKLVLLSEEEVVDSILIKKSIIDNKITHAFLTPSMYSALDDGDLFKGLKCITLAADTVSVKLVKDHFTKYKHVKLFNEYGPTENTIGSTNLELKESEDKIYIGKPIDNVNVYILDKELNFSPIGVIGEVHLSGLSLSRGYIGNNELTNQKFIINPKNQNEILYKSGDLAKWSPDGNIELMGRTDNQIKYRGYRVELEDIENHLKKFEPVYDAVVGISKRDNNEILTAYIIPDLNYASNICKSLSAKSMNNQDDITLGTLDDGQSIFYLSKEELDYSYAENCNIISEIKNLVELNNDSVVFDIGSGIGTFPILLKNEFSKMRLYGFETSSDIYKVLEKNAKLYDGFYTFNFGFAKNIGESKQYYFPNASMFSSKYENIESELIVLREKVIKQIKNEAANELTNDQIEEIIKRQLEYEEIAVEYKPLSKFIKENRIEKIDLINIDIARFGVDILLGFEEDDWKKINAIIIEIDETEIKYELVKELLNSNGYSIYEEKDEEDIRIYAYRKMKNQDSHIPKNEKQLVNKYGRNEEEFISSINSYLIEKIPSYMIPSSICCLNTFPLTENGKIDRKALARLQNTENDTKELYSDIEVKLIKIFSSVLGVKDDSFTKKDNFFALGGHSLKATHLMNEIQKQFNVKISLKEVFAYPSILELAKFIESLETKDYDSILPSKVKEYYEISNNQRRLWLIKKFKPEETDFNVRRSIRIKEEVNSETIKQVLESLMKRHEILNTSIKEINGNPYQFISKILKVPFEFIDLSNLEDHEKISKRESIYLDLENYVFDFSVAPLFRCSLIKLGKSDYNLILCMHHIITDGMSMDILVNDFNQLYLGLKNGVKVHLPEQDIQYKDFSEWQLNQINNTNQKEESYNYWKTKIEDGFPELRLPFENNGVYYSSLSAGYKRVIHKELKSKLQELALKNNTTLSMVLYTCYNIILSLLSKQVEIVASLAVSGRDHVQLKNLVGYFSNSILIKNTIDISLDFERILEHVSQNVIDAIQNMSYPIELVLSDMNVGHPIVNNIFNMINFHEKTPDSADVEEDFKVLSKVTGLKFKFSLVAIEYSNSVAIIWNYKKEFFDEQSIKFMTDSYFDLLSKIVE